MAMTVMKDQIILALRKVTGEGEIHLEFPEHEDHGDYSSNVAMQMGNQNPRKKAEQIIEKLKEDKELGEIVEKIEIAGPGFINFWLKKDILVDNLIQIDSKKEKYGASDKGKGKTVVIDYSSPNIAKSFGIGHLRSTIIGQAVYNLYGFLGYEVVGDNHLGDWGTQFGKLLYMLQGKNEDEIKKLDIQALEELYIEFHKKAEKNLELEEEARNWFKKLEEGGSEARKLWRLCVDISLAEFDRIYRMLGVRIDFAFGESYYESEMKAMLQDPEVKKHLLEGEDGAKIVDLSKFGIKTPLMFLKSDGSTTYATRDLAGIKFRVRKWNPDIIIYEVGAEQTFYFRQLFAAAHFLGLVNEDVELVHTAHGFYLAPDGKKFSTRKGKTIKLEQVLSEAIERAKKLGSEDGKTAEIVGIGAVKYFDLMHSVGSNVVFNWEKIMNMEGNSGPYLQYTVARTNSVLAKARSTKSEARGVSNFDIRDLDLNNEEMVILRKLAQFSEVILIAAKNYSPNVLCNYLFDLAQKYNNFYARHRIIGSDNPELRLKLTFGVGQVLKNGLNLLGIETPERM